MRLIAISVPHLTTHFLQPRHEKFLKLWVQFVGVILALMRRGIDRESHRSHEARPGLDPSDHPRVAPRRRSKRSCRWRSKSSWAPPCWAGPCFRCQACSAKPCHLTDKADRRGAGCAQRRHVALYRRTIWQRDRFRPWFGRLFGWIVGIVFFLLLLSAANTAIVAMIGLLYMMARDGEMPRQFTQTEQPWRAALSAAHRRRSARHRSHRARSFPAVAGLYAIGVVGAITVNLGSCTFNRGDRLHLVRPRALRRHFRDSASSSKSPSRTPSRMRSSSSFACWASVSRCAPTRKNARDSPP